MPSRLLPAFLVACTLAFGLGFAFTLNASPPPVEVPAAVR